MKKRYKYLIALAVIVVVTELVARLGFDIGQKPLYSENTYYEYALQPNQNISRFHNKYITNGYGLRSKNLRKKDKKRVLLFGDSVLNGGTNLDQEETMTYILEDQLVSYYKDSIGVYAASAGSWGVENAYRFLEQKIDFDFDVIILIFSSHDYNDNMHHRKVVGEQPAWPNKQPLLAIGDLWFNGVVPRLNSLIGRNNYNYLDGFDDSNPSPGYTLFKAYSDSLNIPMFVYVHPEKSELKKKSFNSKGLALLKSLEQNNIVNLDGLNTEKEIAYLDNIHINEFGHSAIPNSIFVFIISDNTLGFGK